MSYLRVAARLIRTTLIKTGFDRRLAEATYRQPRGLPARLFRPDIFDYRGAVIRRVERDGILFDLDPGDYVQWTIYFGMEREEKSGLFNLAKPGYVALDIGTNVGEVLLNFAKRVGPDGRAVGFEPNLDTLAQCRHNLSLNGFPNVEVHELALGETDGEVSIGRVDKTNAGADRVVACGGTPVHVTTLDAFAQGFERIDLIKIDVEGFDLKVLRGGQRTIERFRPTLFVELSDRNLREQGDSAEELVRWLETRGYHVRDAVTHDTIKSTDNLDGCGKDIIATLT